MTHHDLLDAHGGPGRGVQQEQHVDADADHDAELQAQEQARQEGGAGGYQVRFCNRRCARATTLWPPHNNQEGRQCTAFGRSTHSWSSR